MTIFSKLAELIAGKVPFCLATLIQASGQYEDLTGRQWLVVTENGSAKLLVGEDVEQVQALNDTVLKLANNCLASQLLMLKRESLAGGEITLFLEPVFADPELVILGAGHIARPLAKMAKLLAYKVTVYDDRPDFASRIHFPDADQIICDDFSNLSAHNLINPNSMVVVVTRGHQHDLACLNQLVGKKLAYLGMIGSRRRSLEIRQLLIAQGFSQEAVDFLHAPIGLDIGADTPEEIAVSIVAEIIQERRKKWRKGSMAAIDRQTYVGSADRGSYYDLKHLTQLTKSQIIGPMAMATIVKTTGSTPRKAGAKMLVNSLGQTFGTIGGGCAEAEVKIKALDVLASKKPTVVKVNLNNDVAGDEGMACGGNMAVFVQPIDLGEDDHAGG